MALIDETVTINQPTPDLRENYQVSTWMKYEQKKAWMKEKD
jgi:hypothetical protein